MRVDLNLCKRYAGIVGNDDDLVMQLCMESAQEYIAASGVPETAQESSQYALCTCMLASHYFDHRNQLTEVQQAPVPSGAVTLILQMKGDRHGDQ